MKTAQERFPELISLFRSDIYSHLKKAYPDGKYIPTTAALRAAAFAAMRDLVESATETEDGPIEPMLALNVWNAVLLCNDSAFHQTMARAIEKKELTGIEIVRGAKAVSGTYFE